MLPMLAAAAILAEPVPAGLWAPVETSYEQWRGCTERGARQRAHEAISADEAGQEAAGACEAEAGRWVEAYRAWLATGQGDPALAEAMAASARCHMARRGAAAAAAYRPAELRSIRSRGPSDERRCPASAPAEAAH